MVITKLSHKAIQRLVARFGYELKAIGTPPSGYTEFLQRMANTGVRPKTVFDVGVGKGTPWLYNAFPHSHFVLLEPQKEFEPELERICAEIDAEYHLVGVGRKEQLLPIYQLMSSSTGSSFLPPNNYNQQQWGPSQQSENNISIVPLDTYQECPSPFFLKLDVEGYELEVLRGATKILAKTDVVLLEVAIEERQVGEPDLIDIGMFMKDNGFRLIDFPTLVQQTTGGPLVYADAAFMRIN